MQKYPMSNLQVEYDENEDVIIKTKGTNASR
jgi:hypothetical protein